MTEAPERIWIIPCTAFDVDWQEGQYTAIEQPNRAEYVRADLPAAVTVDRETIARAICAERCAVYGEPPCYTFEDAPWPNPDCGDCDCHDMADAVLSCLTTQPDPVKDAARVLLEADDYMPTVAKIAAVKAHTLREGKVRPVTVVEGWRAALRALAEQETGQ